MKKFLLLAVALMGVALGSKAQVTETDLTAYDDVIYAGATVAQVGSTDVRLPIRVKSHTNFASFELYLTLPSGATMTGVDGVNENRRSTGAGSVIYEYNPKGGDVYQIVGTVTDMAGFLGGDDELSYVTIDVSGLTVGEYPIQVSDATVSGFMDDAGVATGESDVLNTTGIISKLTIQRAAVIIEGEPGYSISLVPVTVTKGLYSANADNATAYDVYYTSPTEWDGVSFTLSSETEGLYPWAQQGTSGTARNRAAEADGGDDYEFTYTVTRTARQTATIGIATTGENFDFAPATTTPAKIGTIYVDADASLADGNYMFKISDVSFENSDEGTTYTGSTNYVTAFIGEQTETEPIVYGALTAEGIANVNANINPEATNLDITSTSFVDASTEIAPGKNVAVYAAEGVTAMANVLVAGKTCANMNLVDGADFAPATGFTATSATYQRNVTSKFGTLCLPYPVEATAGMKLYVLESVDVDANVMNFAEAANVAANTPVVFYTEDGNISVNASNVNITTSPAGTALNAGKELVGTFAETTITSGYYIAQDKFWKANSAVTIPAFRAYFNMASLGVKSFTINLSDETGIQQLNLDTESGEIYDLAGRKLGKTQRGVNIVNGKKMLVK
ncbi:MAG: hypothetical protein IJV08_05475 [Bacteroidaceae bacterium]|nr:hypothetical protein [Bacteroidaceae bacterium]